MGCGATAFERAPRPAAYALSIGLHDEFLTAHRTRARRKAGALYFALVFGAGFVLGSIRVLLVVPRFGERTAELTETPVMLLVTILAARWVARRLVFLPSPVTRLSVGCVGLGFLLVAEFTVVLWLRGLTISEYFASRDPVAGMVYIVMLGLFAIMPLLLARR